MFKRICMPQNVFSIWAPTFCQLSCMISNGKVTFFKNHIYLQDGRTTECLGKHWKLVIFIVIIIQVSSKNLVKAMLKFVFVLKLRRVELLFIVVFSKGHWVILQLTAKAFKSTGYSVLLYYDLCLRISNVMYQSDAHNWNRKCHLYS